MTTHSRNRGLSRALKLGVCAIALSCCQSLEIEATTFGSGTRLQARMIGVEGEAGILQGFYDSQLEMNCDFVLIGDEYRCLPTPFESPYFSSYSDDGCTIPALLQPADMRSEGEVIATQDYFLCGADVKRGKAYRVGQKLATVYVLNSGECQRRDMVPDQNYHSLAPVTDLGQYAEATVQDEQGVRKVLSTDGAWETIYALNEEGQPCDNGEKQYCIPGPMGIGLDSYYDNDQCSGTNSIYGFVFDDCDYVPSWASASRQDGPEHVVPVLEELDNHYRVDPVTGICEATDFITPAYRAGESVLISSFPMLLEHVDGAGRVQIKHVGVARTASFWDNQLQRGCYPSSFGERTYCRPQNLSKRVPDIWGNDCDGLKLWESTEDFMVIADPNAPGSLTVEAVPFDGPFFLYRDSGDSTSCVEYFNAGVGRVFFAAGQEISPASVMGELKTSNLPN